MPFLDFHSLRHLSPQAFKLYACFLHLAQVRKTSTLTLSLADLGEKSGLQSPCFAPPLRHGNDGQLRRALTELLNAGLLEKQGRRGRKPNTYSLPHLTDTQTQP